MTRCDVIAGPCACGAWHDPHVPGREARYVPRAGFVGIAKEPLTKGDLVSIDDVGLISKAQPTKPQRPLWFWRAVGIVALTLAIAGPWWLGVLHLLGLLS